MKDLFLVTTEEWGQRFPDNSGPIRKPALGVILHHTVTRPTPDPCADMRKLETIGQSRFKAGISYNAGFHPSGVTLEGDGNQRAEHSAGENSQWLGYAAIGNYQEDEPTDAMLDQIAQGIKFAMFTGWCRTYGQGFILMENLDEH
jgi:hypothetical protein